MNFIIPLSPNYTLQIPEEPAALIGWFVWFGIVLLAAFRLRDRQFVINRRILIWLASLSLLILVSTPFFGISLDEVFDSKTNLNLMLFAAVPWMIAGGVLGMLPSVLLAGLSGVLLAYVDTHSIFTPLIFMSLAIAFSWSVQQRYRTTYYRFMRHPLVAAIFSLLLTTPLIVFALLLDVPGTLTSRVVALFHQLPMVIFSISGMVLIGGVICALIRVFFRKVWGSDEPLKPAPGENDLKYRLVSRIAPFALILLTVLTVINWRVTEGAARRLLVSEMITHSGTVTEALPVFLQTGEVLLIDLAQDEALISATPDEITAILAGEIERSHFFDQLGLMDLNGNQIAGFPKDHIPEIFHEAAISVASGSGWDDAVVQIGPLQTDPSEGGTDLGFVTRIHDQTGQNVGLLWGRTILTTSAYFQPISNALTDFEARGGEGVIVSDAGTIIYQTSPMVLMTLDDSLKFSTATYFEGVAANGQEVLQYFEPIDPIDWVLVSSMPSDLMLQHAWQTTLPTLIVATGGMVLVVLLMLFTLQPVFKDVDQIKGAIGKVVRGEFDVAFSSPSALSPTSQLMELFQGMLISLRNRLQAQKDLLTVSDRMTGQLDLENSMQVIMKAALVRGVSSVRVIVLANPQNTGWKKTEVRFGMGKYAQPFSIHDDEIVSICRVQGSLVVGDFQIGNFLRLKEGLPYPASLIAVPLVWKDVFLGAIWATFQERRIPDAEEVGFFEALAKKATVAVLNVKTFDEALTSQMHFETALNAMSDGVVISDRNGFIVYHNLSAAVLLGGDAGSIMGKSLTSLMENERLTEMLSRARSHLSSEEIQTEEGKIFRVIVNPMTVEDRWMGQVTILTDITLARRQELLKNEFVTTASHELQSPLTLMHGYAKILRLTGNLNEQQDSYIRNIISGIDEMKNLVQDLLDLGRLEEGEPLEFVKISAKHFIQKVVEGMDAHARQKNIQLNVNLPEETLMFEAEFTLLLQALKNLVENGIKFTQMGGSVTLSVESLDNEILFTVQDNGIGIAPLDQRHLFEKFNRLNPQPGKGDQGSGLGLAIVKSIAEHHGGRVWVESQLGKGSTFYLQIPRRSPSSDRL